MDPTLDLYLEVGLDEPDDHLEVVPRAPLGHDGQRPLLLVLLGQTGHLRGQCDF